MTTFTQPNFWAARRGRAVQRWSPVLVAPAVAIVSSSVADPTVVTTSVPHGLASGDTVTVAGHLGSTPALSGTLVVTVLTPTTFTVPVAVTVAGSGGTVARTAPALALALGDAKLHAKMNVDQSVEDVPVENWIRAATLQVEAETGIKLLPQTYDIAGDTFPAGAAPIVLPFGPLQSVVSIKSYDTAGALQTMDAAGYLADVSSLPGRIGLADSAAWPTDLRAFQPITLRVIVGYASIGLVPEPLLHAVRVALAWHEAHREPTAIEKQSFDWLLDPFRQVALA